jgi:hypothetical protein
MTFNTAPLLVGEASSFVRSTNNLPPAAYMGRAAVNCHKDSPKGFMGSVIICP